MDGLGNVVNYIQVVIWICACAIFLLKLWFKTPKPEDVLTIRLKALVSSNSVIGLIIFGGLIASGTSLYFNLVRQCPYSYDYSQQRERIVGRRFANEVIILDGHSYDHCSFENVTFKYNGTRPFDLTNNDIRGVVRLQSDNPAVGATAVMLKGLGLTPETFEIMEGPERKIMPIEAPKRQP